ncbi:MAG: AbrB/MazE/SpoVT family DNA-binding domain-containing protein [Nitrosopumilaceae archaeon]
MPEIKFGRRKICKTNYSLTISLPKVWAENANVKQNDLVDLIMVRDGSLVIKPIREDENEEIQ